MHKAVFFDRDGIINRVVMRGNKVSSPRNISELAVVPEAVELVKFCKKLNYLTILATNQPDVARGWMTSQDLKEIHDRIIDQVPLDRIELCDSDEDSNPRRKPNPGMLLDAARHLQIDLGKSFFLGDHGRDLAAGKRAGVVTILLETPYNLEFHGIGDFNCRSLSEVEEVISRGD